MPTIGSFPSASAGGVAADVNLIEVGGAAIALGQALAAASLPVVLTAAQITTLTPPAALTNYANETGGNLAAAAGSLAAMDDWDESDRAKVNPIVGQAGVQGASGTVSANTQRVVLATDVPLPAGTNTLGAVSVTASTMQSLGADATGQDAYATVKTPTANATNILVSLTGANAAIISLDAGTTDHFTVPGGSLITLARVTITSAVAIQAKNATGGSNYTGLSISIW